MVSKIKNRLAREESGFTLIELLVVIVILGILVAIAVPSYLSFRGNAQDAAAQANVRSAIPAAEAWYQDTAGGNSTYTGLTNTTLAQEAPGVSPNVGVDVIGTGDSAYCLFDDEAAGHGAYYVGGDSTLITQSTPAANVATVTKVNVAGSATGASDICGALS